MRKDAIWNVGGFWESPTLSYDKVKNVKIDIAKCNIVINEFGYIDLMLNGVKIKRLTFSQFLKYKGYVKDIETGCMTYGAC